MNTKSLMDSQMECPKSVACGPRIAIRSMAMSAHDLKNHLTGIILLAGRIAEESRTPGAGIDILAARILEGSKRMQTGIDRFMETAAAGTHDQPLQVSQYSLSRLLRQVVKSNWEYALSKDIRLRFLDLGTGECWGLVDEEGMRTAVDNLVNNAIKYSPRASEVQLTLSSHEREGHSFASIRVRDQGPGLKPEDVARAFGPFQTLSTRSTAGESSSGLGLAIVRQVVDRHGGKVWIESTEGLGATFCIDLPCATIPDE